MMTKTKKKPRSGREWDEYLASSKKYNFLHGSPPVAKYGFLSEYHQIDDADEYPPLDVIFPR